MLFFKTVIYPINFFFPESYPVLKYFLLLLGRRSKMTSLQMSQYVNCLISFFLLTGPFFILTVHFTDGTKKNTKKCVPQEATKKYFAKECKRFGHNCLNQRDPKKQAFFEPKFLWLSFQIFFLNRHPWLIYKLFSCYLVIF